MRTITLLNPKRLVFGNNCSVDFAKDFISLGYKNTYIVTAPQILPLINNLIKEIKKAGVNITIDETAVSEPTIKSFLNSLEKAKKNNADSVIGIGGGSVLDVAKLIAALLQNDQTIYNVLGIGNLNGRKTYLACLPTTSGTGSEVSPNAILLDENDNLKKGIISPCLVPDASYIDPMLTITVPPKVTAATGMDALTHCIEAYANKYSHPVVDLYALEGIKLIGKNLKKAYGNGEDIEARESLALGSLFGGLCLGPVNTGAVHALSYPLGGEFHIAHGLSNALLLPYVIDFNIPAAPKRYAEIAKALGAEPGKNDEETSKKGIEILMKLAKDCKIPLKLSEINISKEDINKIAEMAMTVTRLLKNNLREIKFEDAKKIYENAY